MVFITTEYSGRQALTTLTFYWCSRVLLPRLFGDSILATAQAGTLDIHPRSTNILGVPIVTRARILLTIWKDSVITVLCPFREANAGLNPHRKQAADFTTLIPTFTIEPCKPWLSGYQLLVKLVR